MVQIEQCSKNKCIKNIDLALKMGVLNPGCLDALYGLRREPGGSSRVFIKSLSQAERTKEGACAVCAWGAAQQSDDGAHPNLSMSSRPGSHRINH